MVPIDQQRISFTATNALKGCQQFAFEAAVANCGWIGGHRGYMPLGSVTLALEVLAQVMGLKVLAVRAALICRVGRCLKHLIELTDRLTDRLHHL